LERSYYRLATAGNAAINNNRYERRRVPLRTSNSTNVQEVVQNSARSTNRSQTGHSFECRLPVHTGRMSHLVEMQDSIWSMLMCGWIKASSCTFHSGPERDQSLLPLDHVTAEVTLYMAYESREQLGLLGLALRFVSISDHSFISDAITSKIKEQSRQSRILVLPGRSS